MVVVHCKLFKKLVKLLLELSHSIDFRQGAMFKICQEFRRDFTVQIIKRQIKIDEFGKKTYFRWNRIIEFIHTKI